MLSLLLFMGLMLCLTSSGICGTDAEEPSVKEVPNIVAILTDNLGYGDVSHLKHKSQISPPEFDAPAAEGANAIDAHAPDAFDSPDHYAMLVRRYA